ncbi:AMP-binding protein [Cobetia crustatorum]|uniref:AMP-binding protein n=1 Tax=Cobetia crustatorum TaxID=553385 RepID=A0A558HN62_9GAMM|nr:AMP-binding protein [Cobetia crustatorum]TVU70565.1 AMP-binding protein [Cobetia crustatorum]
MPQDAIDSRHPATSPSFSAHDVSYLSATSDTPLMGETIGDCLDRICATYPERDALISCHQNLRYNWTELHQEVERVARGLLAMGITRGDRVGIWSPNRAEWTLIQYATAKIGVVLVNLNPSYRGHELAYALKQSGAATLLFQSRFKGSDYVAILEELFPESSQQQGRHGIHNVALPDLKRLICFEPGDALPGMLHWQDVLSGADNVTHEAMIEIQRSLTFDDPINIQYTSGTTGAPKGATLSHHNILNNGFFVAERMNLSEHDKLVMPVPLYHCFGMVMGNLGCLTHGAAIIYPEAGFDPLATLQAVSEEGATAMFGVPTMFIAELEHPRFGEFDLSSLRTGTMAGSICPIEVMRQVIERMHMSEVTIAYGMTETSPVSLQTTREAPLEKRVSTVGTLHPHLEIKIVDPDTGRVVSRGEKGELCTRGYSVMLGYWNNPESTAKAIDSGRWMHTGDLATLDSDGYVTIVGRIKDMIIRGGENIYPREIEDFLYTHPAVSDVQVIGVPDERYGEEVMAWVKLKDGEQLDAEGLKAFCQGRIAHFKVPRYIKFVDEFPMTVTGKIQKFKMRETATAELGLDE